VVDAQLHPVGDARAGSPPTASHRAERLGLYQSISYRCSFVRACHYRQPACVGRELAEQGIVHAAADDVDGIDALSRQIGSQAQGSPVGEGQAVEDRTSYLWRCFGSRLTQIA